MRKLMALVVLSSLLGCATTNKNNRLLMTGAGVLAGAAIGASRPEEQGKNAVLYGGLLGLTAGVASLYVFDEEKSETKLKREIEELKSANDILKNQMAPKFASEGTSLLSAPLPKDVRNLVKPGGWRKYKLDRWSQDSENENVWYRQTEMFEIIPPSVGAN